MHKYQFHIAFNDKANTAASKAVQDCKSILTEMGYRDCSIEDVPLNDTFYLFKLIRRLVSFFMQIKPGSMVAIQYPLLSGNALFKHFIRAARLKKVKFFCVVHDLDDLRYADEQSGLTNDIDALSYYDYVIVHNSAMENWLVQNGLQSTIIQLHAFDYLAIRDGSLSPKPEKLNTIVYAGNLSKSRFIYALDIISKWQFNLYGPNYMPEKASLIKNICWNGSLSPDEVVAGMSGAFGLVWDGEYIDRLDNAYGNYLKYNYPHKLSLYLAAGLPVIAPSQSAISSFIQKYQVGVLIDDLLQLQDLNIGPEAYQQLKDNARRLSIELRAGKFFTAAIAQIEADILIKTTSLQTDTLYY